MKTLLMVTIPIGMMLSAQSVQQGTPLPDDEKVQYLLADDEVKTAYIALTNAKEQYQAATQKVEQLKKTLEEKHHAKLNGLSFIPDASEKKAEPKK